MRFHRSLMAVAVLAGTASAEPQTSPSEVDLEIESLGEVHFGFDSARPAGIAPVTLAAVAMWASEHPDARIVLDGHTDTTGAPAYNVGLAVRRAESVQSKLVMLGVDPDRLVIVTYGEDGLQRSDAAASRRVVLWATTDPLFAVITRSLVRGTAVVWDKPVVAAELTGPRAPEVATR